MTVREVIKKSENSGTIKVYSRTLKCYVRPYQVADQEVLTVKEKRGYGAKQINITLHIR